jgi:ribose transport system ATP-binding protein
MNVLEASNIKKAFGGEKALVNASMCCPEGKIVGLIGANGSGKTTFSRVITGMIKHDGGKIICHGNVVNFHSPKDSKREGIIMVHQHLSLIPDQTVWENICLGDEPLNALHLINNNASRKTAQEALKLLCPNVDIETKARDLSPSNKQLVEITKAIWKNPKLLILDESTSSLEKEEVMKLFNILRDMSKKGVAIIFISHRLWEVKEICDFIVVFRNGETVGEIDFAKEGKDDSKIISLITGKETQLAVRKQTDSVTTERFMEVKELNYRKKVHNVSLAVNKGEIIGIGGLQAQGQEELLMLLAGHFHPQSGQILIEGRQCKFGHPSEAIKNGIVLVPGDRQTEGLFLNHSILMNMVYTRFSLKDRRLFIPFKKYKKMYGDVVKELSIKTDDIDNKIKNLSGGNQQKVVVGKWFPMNPSMILLDDPTKGVDIQAKKDLYDVILGMAKNGTCIILYTSDNEEFLTYCDRILIMFEGEIIRELSKETLNESSIIAASLRAD